MKNMICVFSLVYNSFRQSNILAVCALLILTVVTFGNSSFCQAQNSGTTQKKITKEVFRNEPIEITALKSNGKSFNLIESSAKDNSSYRSYVVQSENLFKDFTINFNNTSGKSIIFINAALSFPEAISDGRQSVYFLKYGIDPPLKNDDQPRLLVPNQSGQIILNPARYDKLQSFLASENYSLQNLTEGVLTIQTVIFNDGTMWYAGSFYRPDPNKPGKYIHLLNKYT